MRRLASLPALAAATLRPSAIASPTTFIVAGALGVRFGSTTSGSSSSNSSNSSTTNGAPGAAEEPVVDAKAAEQMRVAQEIGQEAFEENTAILKQVASRGLRAFVVCGLGLVAFSYAMKRKRAELAKESGESVEEEDEMDPTQRYLEEMRGLGFDVDTLEEELEQERKDNKKGAVTAATAVGGGRQRAVS